MRARRWTDASQRPPSLTADRPFLRHIRNEHNLWHYLAFMVHLRVKRATVHRPRSFVKQMLDKKDLTFFPILRTSSITVEDSVSNEHVLERVEALARTVLEGNERVEELLAKMSEGDGGSRCCISSRFLRGGLPPAACRSHLHSRRPRRDRAQRAEVEK